MYFSSSVYRKAYLGQHPYHMDLSHFPDFLGLGAQVSISISIS